MYLPIKSWNKPIRWFCLFYRHAHEGLEGHTDRKHDELRFQTSLGVSIFLSPEAAQPARCWAAGWMWGQTREKLKSWRDLKSVDSVPFLLPALLNFSISFSWCHIYLQLLNIRRLQRGDLFKAWLLKCLFWFRGFFCFILLTCLIPL